jgi:hypothetical protein
MNPNIKIIVSLWLFNLKIHFFFNNQWKWFVWIEISKRVPSLTDAHRLKTLLNTARLR